MTLRENEFIYFLIWRIKIIKENTYFIPILRYTVIYIKHSSKIITVQNSLMTLIICKYQFFSCLFKNVKQLSGFQPLDP